MISAAGFIKMFIPLVEATFDPGSNTFTREH